jgi:hypothetical protein
VDDNRITFSGGLRFFTCLICLFLIVYNPIFFHQFSMLQDNLFFLWILYSAFFISVDNLVSI